MLSPRMTQAKTFVKSTMPGLLAAFHSLKRIPALDPARKRRHLNAFIRRQTGSKVVSGPFVGMLLVEPASWGDGDIAPKLLGVYEQELHSSIEQAATRPYDAIIDIGCAEGYYAIGLALLLPRAIVHAFDTDQAALAIAKQAAVANGVAERVRFGGFCGKDVLIALCRTHERLLVVSDCEGFEVELFTDPAVRDALDGSDLLIECHDVVVPGGTDALVSALKPSHVVQRIHAPGRNPNRFDFLGNLHETDRWQAVCENRPFRSHWLFCESAPRA